MANNNNSWAYEDAKGFTYPLPDSIKLVRYDDANYRGYYFVNGVNSDGILIMVPQPNSRSQYFIDDDIFEYEHTSGQGADVDFNIAQRCYFDDDSYYPTSDLRYQWERVPMIGNFGKLEYTDDTSFLNNLIPEDSCSHIGCLLVNIDGAVHHIVLANLATNGLPAERLKIYHTKHNVVPAGLIKEIPV